MSRSLRINSYNLSSSLSAEYVRNGTFPSTTNSITTQPIRSHPQPENKLPHKRINKHSFHFAMIGVVPFPNIPSW